MVTATFQKLSVQVPVEVVDIKSIDIAPASARIVGPVGTTIQLTATEKNSVGKAVSWPITWTSSRPRVATISPQGRITSVGPGTATHCDRFAALDREAAKEARDLASAHEHMAAAK